MKGIIFNLAEEVLTQAHGSEVWDSILERAGVDGAYTSLGSYADQELIALVRAASEIGRASCRERGSLPCRSRWSPDH